MLCLVAVGLNGVAAARADARVTHAALIASRDRPASMETRFAVTVLDAARAQLALSELALARHPNDGLADLATQAHDVWQGVESQIVDLAKALRLNVPATLTPSDKQNLARFARLNDAAFERAYRQSLERSDRVAIGAMESLDGLVDQHVLFFADQQLPHVLALQAQVEAPPSR